MSSTGRKNGPPVEPHETSQDESKDKSKTPSPPPRVQNDNGEDGDIATPKQDRCGNDDEPL